MKQDLICGLPTKENFIFCNDFNEISHKISQILPFSKIAVLCFSNEYFGFYQQFKPVLLKNGLKVIDVILNDNFAPQKEHFESFLSLPEDVRGVIAFNKKLISLILSNYLKDKTAFFIPPNQDCFGLMQRFYYYREFNSLRKENRNSNSYIMINAQNKGESEHIKSACLYLHMLIDYILRQSLLQENMDMRFINKIKAILIDIYIKFKTEKAQTKKTIENLLFVEDCLAKKDCFYSCSALISCFIENNDFFNLDYSFIASKVITIKYAQAFNKRLEKRIVDYNEIVKTLCFVTQLSQKDILHYLDSQIAKINTKGVASIKQEILKLILLYNDFKKLLKTKSIAIDKLKKQTLDLSILLSGYTPFGINGMTAI